MPKDKLYIGDGVYLEIESYQIILTTENGRETANLIYLDFEVLRSLIHVLKSRKIIT